MTSATCEPHAAEAFVELRSSQPVQTKVSAGDKVFIKVANEELWLCQQPQATYCAAVGPKHLRVPFVVTFLSVRMPSGHRQYIRLEYEQAYSSYLEENKFLYAANTGSAKYDADQKSLADGILSHLADRKALEQQLWVLDVNDDVDLHYDKPVSLLDCHSKSFMAAALSYSAASYSYSAGTFWVHVKHAQDVGQDFRSRWIFERVPA